MDDLRPRNITTRKAEKRLDDTKGYHGLYAREPIARGELVWISFLRPEDCELFPWSHLEQNRHLVKYAYQIDSDVFSHSKDVDADISNFLNHACDPNCWYDYSLATKLRFFLEHVIAPRAADRTSPFHGALPELEAFFAHYPNGHDPNALPPTLARAHELFESRFMHDKSIEYIVARKDIARDAELTMDYSTFWTVSDLEFECHCGSPQCRRQVRKDDYRRMDPAHVALYVSNALSR